MATDQEQLVSVQTAIADIEANGQHIADSSGRVFTKADLKTLYAREEKLLARVKTGSLSIFDRARTITPCRD